MALVGDHDRERTTASLRRHFVEGRLSVEDLETRLDRTFAARSASELRAAQRGLPWSWPASVRRGMRIAALVALGAVWAVVSLSLAIGLAVTMIAFGPSLAVAIGFGAIWVAVTFVLGRPAWRATRPRPGYRLR
jgi:uncharacterized membrane protein